MSSAGDTLTARLEAVLPGGADHPLFDAAWYRQHHAEVALCDVDPFEHFAARGSATGCRPNRLFDPRWYLARYPEVRVAGIDPFVHYLLAGEAAGYRPNPLFHTAWLREQHPGVTSPLAFYLHPELHPELHPDLQPDLQPGPPGQTPWPNPLFDPSWYRERHGLAEGADALAHFLEEGVARGIDPHPLFDTAYYLDRYPEVAAAGDDPLAHFLDVGAAAGYDPHPLFDTAWYAERYLDAASDVNSLVHYVEEGAARGHRPHPFFDGAWYASRYPNVGASGVNPLVHYVEVGMAENRQPNPLFDPDWYLAQHPELAPTRREPLLHYLEQGHEPGNAPNPLFDRYADFFRDGPVESECIETDADNPLRDYLARGLAPPAQPETPLARPSCAEPLVSIVIPVFNQVPHTLACLRSLAAVRCEVPFEIIVVDDASDAVAYPTLLADTEGVRVVRAESNRGFVRGCNAGAAAARGRFVVYLNNDTTVCDDWLDELVASFERFPDVGIVGSKTVFPNGRVAEAGGIVWRDGSAGNFGRQRTPADPEVDYARDADYVSGAALMIERALFDELGGFDERFCPAYYEDTDLAFRVREAGRRVLYQPASEVVHFEGTSQGTNLASGLKAHQVVNQAVFFERWRDVLARHGETGVLPEREKDRQTRLEALVIDVCTPSSTRDARSQRLFLSMLALRDAGYRVTFVPENFDAPEPFGRQLRSHGIRVLTPPTISGIEALLAREGERFDVCLAGRPATGRRLVRTLKKQCPNARVLLDGTDLMDPGLVASLLGEARPGTSSAIPPVVEIADATLVMSSGKPAGHPVTGRDDIHVLPHVFQSAGPRPGFEERRDVFVVTGLQRAPLVDALLWLRDEILPALPDELDDVRFFVRECDVVAGLGIEDERLIALPERKLTDVHALDRFRVAVAPNRFGACLTGPLHAALARGLPCIATTHTSGELAAPLAAATTTADGTREFAEAVAQTHRDAERWRRASAIARKETERLFSYARARDVLERAARSERR